MSFISRPEELTYIYDGSFYGLMTIAYEVAKGKTVPRSIIAGEAEELLLFNDYIRIATDYDKAEEIIQAINTSLPRPAYRRVLFCYLSESPHASQYIIDYLNLGWRYGKLLDHHSTHKHVMSLLGLSEKVAREWHRMMGLIRFKLAAVGIYYTQIEPDYNVLPLLSPHFAERMAGERWIIHDVGRNIASRYFEGEWDIVDFKIIDEIAYGNAELNCQNLWHTYFANIAISYRKNKKLQKQYLPQRYWKHLVEPIAD